MQKPIYADFKVFKAASIIKSSKVKWNPRSLHNKEYFWIYDEKYKIFSYFLCFSAALFVNISILLNMDRSVLHKLFKYFFYDCRMI